MIEWILATTLTAGAGLLAISRMRRDPVVAHRAALATLVLVLALPLLTWATGFGTTAAMDRVDANTPFTWPEASTTRPQSPVAVARTTSGLAVREGLAEDPSLPAAAGASASDRLGAALIWVWLLGGLVYTTRYLLQLVCSYRLVRCATPAEPVEVALPGLRELRYGLRFSDQCAVAFLWPGRKPTVVVPSPWRHGTGHVDVAVAHELMHARRGDGWALWLAAVVAAIHWFNPLVRKLVSMHAELIEEACDRALIDEGVDRADYASTLVFAGRSQAGLPLPTMAVDQASLSMRVRRVLQDSAPVGRWRMTVVLSLLLPGLLLVGASAVAAYTAVTRGEVETPPRLVSDQFTSHKSNQLPRDTLQVVTFYDGTPNPEARVSLQIEDRHGHRGWIAFGPLLKFDERIQTWEVRLNGSRVTGLVELSGIQEDGIVDGIAVGLVWRDMDGIVHAHRSVNPTPGPYPTSVCTWPVAIGEEESMARTGQLDAWGAEAARRAICGAELMPDGLYRL